MLKLLRIVDKVEKPVMINEAVSLNISANGDCPDDITSILGKLVNLSNPQPVTDKMMPQGDNHDVMMKTISNVGDYANQAAHDYANEVGEEYANEPNPEISDVEYMTKDLAGGLNKPKKQFKKEYPGDNPMTMAEARAAELMIEYRKLIEGSLENARAAQDKVKDLEQQAYDAERMGDEKTMRRRFADAALQKLKNKEAHQASVKKVNELSPATLASYAKKASSSSHPNSAPNLASRAGYELGQSPDDDFTAGEKHDKKSATRSKFIGKAIDRLSR